MKRTHTCGELVKKDVKKKVVLQGWVHKRRDHGGIIFIDLRDRYGLTQIVFDPKHEKKTHELADTLRREDVIEVEGKVRPRPKTMINKKLHTGEIEVIINRLDILNKAATPPIEVDDYKVANDDLRLRYRYLDLRRPMMQKFFIARHKATMAARNYLASQNFLEIETPFFVKSTPEGARDYIVPSRVNPGQFYSLPQSPQLYKQLLMVAGFDRYFQVVRCMRDEDLRIDRQPEFTQIDIEMTFAEQDDVLAAIEGTVKAIFKEAIGKNIKIPFKRMPYKESMDKYGTDKPDLRFGLELTEITEEAKESDYGIFKGAIKNKGIVKCIRVPVELSRKQIDDLTKFAQKFGAKGLSWMRITKKGPESSIVKYFGKKVLDKILKKAKAKPGTSLLFIADKPSIANDVLARIRLKFGEDLKLYNPKDHNFAWIVDYPLFEWNDEEKKWDPMHHIFSMPKKECLKYMDTDPGKVLASLYDLVLNGVELGSGSIRNHDPTLQEKSFKIIGLKKAEAEQKFGFLLEAFKYGAPPHAGFAIGYDRLVALMLGFLDIRDVIAFPKNKAAQCPMDGCPGPVEDQHLKDLNIKLDMPKKKK
ncbi:MAG: aspartate--tRNA ligase [Nanoarchaeota archaeon]|nr:aspartate--tRNA ligase [Nanoarchaeota archaeon]